MGAAASTDAGSPSHTYARAALADAAAQTHFTPEEVATLHEHFKAISSSASEGAEDGAGSFNRDEFLRGGV